MEKIRRLLVGLANWQYFGLTVLVLASLVLHVATITNPQDTIFDEAHYVIDGRRILAGEGTERVEHPPLGKLFIVGGMKLFGDNPWGWRVPSLLVGTIGLILFYGICRKLGAGHRVAFLATFLLTFENLSFIHAGMAMLDEYTAFFTILAFWLYLKGLERKSALFNEWWFFMAIAIALSALAKLSGVLTALPIGLHWLLSGYRKPPPVALPVIEPLAMPEIVPAAPGEPVPQSVSEISTEVAPEAAPAPQATPPPVEPPRESLLRRTGGFFYGYVYSLPFLLYALMVPVFLLGLMSVFDWMIWQKWINPIDQLTYMSNLTSSIKFTGYTAPLPSRPWEWLLSPSNSFSLYQWMFSGGSVPVQVLGYDWPPYGPHITGMASPTIFFATLAAIPFAMWQFLKRKLWLIPIVIWFVGVGLVPALAAGHASSSLANILSFGWFALIIPIIFFMKKDLAGERAAAFAICWLIGTWAIWMPLSIITDRVSFSFYYLPTVPALCLMAGLLLDRLFKSAGVRHKRDLRGLIRGGIAVFIFLHLVVFCLLSPNKLTISISASILVLAFVLDYLGYSWQTMASAVVAVTAGVLGLRYILYKNLEQWFGTETIVGLYPANIWFWVVGAVVTLIVMGIVYGILKRFVFKKHNIAEIHEAV